MEVPAAAATASSQSSSMSAAAAGNAAGRFADRATESLYQSYNAKQKRAAFACYVSASVLFDVYCLTVYDRWSPWTWSLLAVNLATLLWCRVAGGRRRHWSAMAHLAWFTSVVQVVFHMVANTADGADLLGWILLYDYLTYVSLPVTLTLCVALSATTCITYVLTMAALADHHAYLARQVMCHPPPPPVADVAVVVCLFGPNERFFVCVTFTKIYDTRVRTLSDMAITCAVDFSRTNFFVSLSLDRTIRIRYRISHEPTRFAFIVLNTTRRFIRS